MSYRADAEFTFRSFFFPVLIGGVVLFFLSPCIALAAPRVELEVTAEVVGVGQSFRVQSMIVEEDGKPAPRSPKLAVRGEAQIRGPSIGSQHSFVMRGFSMKSERRVQASWIVTPTKVGKVRVGPVSFDVDGKRVASDSIVVEVTNQPQAPASPFDLLRQRRRHVRLPEAPPEYRLDHAADSTAFLHAKLSKKKVIVGEPVRLEVLAYGSRGDFMEHSPKAPSFGDFISHTVIENSEAEPPYQVTVGGRKYVVRKILEFVLVPLRTGSLVIEPMTAILQGRMRQNYPPNGHPQGFAVSSLPLDLQVVSAPQDGKPPGFSAGDVGSYGVEADVSPREIRVGEYVEIVMSVRGRGQIPSKVILPESRDLVWEKPTLRGGPEIRDGVLQGRRTLKYTVQINRVGEIDLGHVRLPFYDPERQRYRDIKANLGSVRVKASAARAVSGGANQSAPTRSVPNATQESVRLKPRRELRSLSGEEAVVPLWSWIALFGAPIGTWVGLGLSRLARGTIRRQRSTGGSRTKKLLRKAQQDLKSEREPEALSTLEKALFEALLEKSGVRARGLLRENVALHLAEVGFEETLAQTIQQTLIELESSRYGAANQSDSKELMRRVSSLVKRIPSLSSRGGEGE